MPERRSEVPTLVRETDAPGKLPPEESITVPTMDPVDWASSSSAPIERANIGSLQFHHVAEVLKYIERGFIWAPSFKNRWGARYRRPGATSVRIVCAINNRRAVYYRIYWGLA